VAVALAAGGLLLLERSPASATSAPHVVRSAHPAASGAEGASAPATPLESVTSQLRGAASLMTQTLPDLDATTAASTADVATSATQAASVSQQLATIASRRSADVATDTTRVTALAGQLQGALTITQSKAAAVAQAPLPRAPISLPIKFCNFTIQIGPIIINIPQLHIHIVIGPFFIHFRAPCFLSGRFPTHIP
jgi:hypothetical protein